MVTFYILFAIKGVFPKYLKPMPLQIQPRTILVEKSWFLYCLLNENNELSLQSRCVAQHAHGANRKKLTKSTDSSEIEAMKSCQVIYEMCI